MSPGDPARVAIGRSGTPWVTGFANRVQDAVVAPTNPAAFELDPGTTRRRYLVAMLRRLRPALTLLTFASMVAVLGFAPAPAAAGPAPVVAPASVPSDDEIFETIGEITSHGPRRVGTPGIEFVVDYIADKYRSFGLTGVHVETTPTYSWEPEKHALGFAGTPIDASPVIYSQSPERTAVGTFSTPPGGLRAPIVDVGLGTPAEIAANDVEGKIVIFDLKFLVPLAGFAAFTEFLWDPENTLATSPNTLLQTNPFITTYTDAVEAAIDGGAVGFVGVLGDYFDSNRYHNESYRSLVNTIPGMWVTKAEGARIRALMAANPGGEARLVLKNTREEVDAHAVVGYLEGKSRETLMVQSHHDSGFKGAVEDGSGVAEVLALAEHYSAQPRESREKTLMFTTFDSHFSGYQAHFAFVKRHITERDPTTEPHRIVANVTLEHVGKTGSIGPDGGLAISDQPEPRGIFENLGPAMKTAMIGAIVGNDLRRTTLLNALPFQAIGVPTDASMILAAGVPVASLIAGPLYLYDRADTLDKVAKDELQRVAVTFIEIVDALDETPSSQIGLIPPLIADPLGVFVLDNLGGEKGSEESTDQPPCRPTRAGKPVRELTMREAHMRVELTFLAARQSGIEIEVEYAGGRTAVLSDPERVQACRRYRVLLPGSAEAARISGRGGTARVEL